MLLGRRVRSRAQELLLGHKPAGRRDLFGAVWTDDGQFGGRGLCLRGRSCVSSSGHKQRCQHRKIRSKDIESILQAEHFLFGLRADFADAGQGQQDEGPVDQTPQRSGLPLQLISTMVSPGDWDWSMAVIRDTSDDRKRVGIFRRGDKLTQGGAIVAQVVEGRVYMVVGKRVEYITSDRNHRRHRRPQWLWLNRARPIRPGSKKMSKRACAARVKLRSRQEPDRQSVGQHHGACDKCPLCPVDQRRQAVGI